MPVTINADNGAVSGSAGLKTAADSSGVLALQSNGTTGLTLNTSLALGVGSGNSTGTTGQVLTSQGSGAAPIWAAGGGGSGDVVGPASATNNGIALFDGTTGKLLKNSSAQDGLIHGMTVGRGAGAVATNTAVGLSALGANTSGDENTAFGRLASRDNTTGQYNTSVGSGAALLITTGSNNTAIGRAALQAATTSSNNTSVGYRAMIATNTGASNTALGSEALQANTTASNNTAVGFQAGYTNSTGTGNLFLGFNAGYATTTGSHNTLVGRAAGQALTTGASNTFIGGYDPSTGGSGAEITTGSNNTILGPYNGNQGGLDIRTASNNIVLSDGDGNPRQWWNSQGISRTQSSTGVYASGTLITTTFANASVGLVLYVGSIPSLGYNYQFNQLIAPGIWEIAAFGGPAYESVGPGFGVGYCIFSVDINNVFTIITSNVRVGGDAPMSASFNTGSTYISWLSQNQGYQNYPRMMFRRLGFNYAP